MTTSTVVSDARKPLSYLGVVRLQNKRVAKITVRAVQAAERRRKRAARDKVIAASFSAGEPAIEIAARHGLSASRVTTICRREGACRPYLSMKLAQEILLAVSNEHQMTPAQLLLRSRTALLVKARRRLYDRLHDAGFNFEEIGLVSGRSPTTVMHCLRLTARAVREQEGRKA